MDRVAFVQRTLFKDLRDLPQGFRYRDDVLSPDQESALITSLERLPFREFEFRGFLGKRRTVSFGCHYDFNVRKLQKAEEIPTFLLALCQTAAEFARLTEDRLQHVLVTEYAPGPPRIRRCDRHIAGDALPVPLPPQTGYALGARINRAPTPFSVSSPWLDPLGLAAQHPSG